MSRFKQWVLESAAPLPSSWGTGAMGRACTGRAAPNRIRRGSHLRPCSLRQVYTSWSMDGFGDSTREPGIHSLWRQSPCDRMVMLTCNPPHTLNPQPSTLNPQPSTLNPQPSTLNPKPYTLKPLPLRSVHAPKAQHGKSIRSYPPGLISHLYFKTQPRTQGTVDLLCSVT